MHCQLQGYQFISVPVITWCYSSVKKIRLTPTTHLLLEEKTITNFIFFVWPNWGDTHSKKLVPETCCNARDQNHAVWMIGCVWKWLVQAICTGAKLLVQVSWACVTHITVVHTCCYKQGDHSPGKPGKVGEFQSGQGKVRENGKSQRKVRGSEIRCVFSSSKYSKTRFFGRAPGSTGGAYDAPPNPLVGWGGGHPIPFPKLLQPQLLNNWLSGLALFFINMKQRLLTISVNTRYWVIFACLYWKSRGISCGLESGHPV